MRRKLNHLLRNLVGLLLLLSSSISENQIFSYLAPNFDRDIVDGDVDNDGDELEVLNFVSFFKNCVFHNQTPPWSGINHHFLVFYGDKSSYFPETRKS